MYYTKYHADARYQYTSSTQKEKKKRKRGEAMERNKCQDINGIDGYKKKTLTSFLASSRHLPGIFPNRYARRENRQLPEQLRDT